VEKKEGKPAICFSVEQGLEGIGQMTSVDKIIVASPSGLRPAKYLEKNFGIPWETGLFFDPLVSCSPYASAEGKTLILHQQILGNSLREAMEAGNTSASRIDVGTYFMAEDSLKREGDLELRSEADLLRALPQYDTILCDPVYQRAMKDYTGKVLTLPHFAVSGEIGQTAKEEELLP
jgi:hypothetical protein